MKKTGLILLALSLGLMFGCKTDNNNKKDEVTVMNEATEEVSDDVELNDVAIVEATFGVRGNCGMCKNTIEKAAKSIEGVKTANWDMDKKMITVKFDNDETNTDDIQKSIAASGYDTSDFKGDDKAYASNAKCCQYDRTMEIN